MVDICLLIILFIIFIFGYFMMDYLDTYIISERKDLRQMNHGKKIKYIKLKKDLSDEKMILEIHQFRQKHADMQIVLYDFTESDVKL